MTREQHFDAALLLVAVPPVLTLAVLATVVALAHDVQMCASRACPKRRISILVRFETVLAPLVSPPFRPRCRHVSTLKAEPDNVEDGNECEVSFACQELELQPLVSVFGVAAKGQGVLSAGDAAEMGTNSRFGTQDKIQSLVLKILGFLPVALGGAERVQDIEKALAVVGEQLLHPDLRKEDTSDLAIRLESS